MKRIIVGCLAVTVMIGAVGCPMVAPLPEDVDQFEVVRTAFAAYFGSDPPGAKPADQVLDAMDDANELNQPYILSVRAADDFATGHVPGADNIPWRQIAQVGATDDVPTDREIVVYCYTGHTGAVATAYLGARGFDAVNMKFGMCAWTQDEEVRATQCFDDAVDSNDFDVETTDNPGSATNDLPVLDVTDSADEAEIIRAAADVYLTDAAPVITAAGLFELLDDGIDSNDPFIVSVRAPDAYALGHIPGAINIPWKTIADLDNLRKLPPDRDIVVYCYTGHTGGLATTALNLLGYNAKNLKFGIISWTQDAEVRVASPFGGGNDFMVE